MTNQIKLDKHAISVIDKYVEYMLAKLAWYTTSRVDKYCSRYIMREWLKQPLTRKESAKKCKDFFANKSSDATWGSESDIDAHIKTMWDWYGIIVKKESGKISLDKQFAETSLRDKLTSGEYYVAQIM